MTKHATLYRMKTPEHVCPFGIKSLHLLERQGYDVDDCILTSRDEVDDFKEEHGVETTPQSFIDNERIGGYDDLKRFFGKETEAERENQTSYRPVAAIFGMGAAIAVAQRVMLDAPLFSGTTLMWFMALSMCLLALMKLRDVSSFSNSFVGYDLLAQRDSRYAYVYPYAEALAGLLMLSGKLLYIAIPVAFVIGSIGAVSVVKAVYIDKRDIKCACVGGDSNVPLGFISLLENLMMVFMSIWMFVRTILGGVA